MNYETGSDNLKVKTFNKNILLTSSQGQLLEVAIPSIFHLFQNNTYNFPLRVLHIPLRTALSVVTGQHSCIYIPITPVE